MKNEQNQEFTYKFWALPFFALIILLCLALSPLGKSSSEEKIVRARAKAEVLAYQVAQLFRENAQSMSAQETVSSEISPGEISGNKSRMPAAIDSSGPAEGLMGQDPWGHAFKYKIVSEGEKLRVEMRSAGPDGIPDQEPAGDDVVLTLSL